jgi:hypothetical protein
MSTLSMHIVTYVSEYLGEFEFIFENVLDYESGDQMGTLDAKKITIEILMLGHNNIETITLNLICFYIIITNLQME